MAQYLISVIDDGVAETTPDQMAAINAFNDGLRAEGRWVFAGGLADPSASTVVDARGADPVFTDGPYLESKEYLIGFWVIEAPHLDAALRIATGGSRACDRKVELRPFR